MKNLDTYIRIGCRRLVLLRKLLQCQHILATDVMGVGICPSVAGGTRIAVPRVIDTHKGIVDRAIAVNSRYGNGVEAGDSCRNP